MRDICFCGQSVSDLEAFAAKASAPPVVERERAKARVKAMNKTETRWLREVKPLHYPVHVALAQALTLPLDGGGTYRPDFMLVAPTGGIVLVETKGGYRGPGAEQGIERYRRARTQWEKAYFRFEMWEWKKKKWEVER
jgi:hypothetical protein